MDSREDTQRASFRIGLILVKMVILQEVDRSTNIMASDLALKGRCRQMFDFIKRQYYFRKNEKEFRRERKNNEGSQEPRENGALSQRLVASLDDNMVKIRQLYSNSSDFVANEMTVSGIRIQILICEGMVNTQTMAEMLIEPLYQLNLFEDSTPQGLQNWLRNDCILANDQQEFRTYGELFRFMMSGFAIVLVDGIDVGLALGLQGFQFRSVSEPSAEVNVRGSREGFIEILRINLTMVRRRIKSPNLKFEMMTLGSKSQTDICLVYLTDKVSDEILHSVKRRLGSIRLDVILESGYLQPFLDDRPLSIFSQVGHTERPDTLCAKINEGRIGILVDGTPFALVVPYFFAENFQSFDDYCHRAFYATFIRWLKYISFFSTILLPGIYVAIATFHPELFPYELLFNIASSEEATPFPLVVEAIIIFIIYEIMREAGLRLPRPIGHAVSIVGALVIGDAAVTAGIIGAPMVMVVALTAISSFVVPSLYEPVTILRFSFIIIGGALGLYGITLAGALVLSNICAINAYGIPFTAPITPFNLFDMRDVVVRKSWQSLQKEQVNIQSYPGSEIK